MGNWLLALFVFFQMGLLVVAWRKLSTEDNAWHTRTNAWASILTVFGIFGTFLGIFIGLLGFNVENIEGSIGPLLEGLKLAFLTSLVGIGSALGLKFVALSKTRDGDDPAIKAFIDALTKVETSGESNLASQLKALTTTVEREGQETRGSLGGIKTVVTKNHTELTTMQSEEGSQTRRTLKEMEASLSAQLQALATTSAEKHDLLVKEFQTFSQNLAESIAKLATEELIDALKTVIEDFNTKISEQFGDNFKQLNEAVRQTVEWQKQYRQQMVKLASEFQIAAASIERSRDSLEKIESSSRTIAEQSSSIVDCAAKLEPLLHTLNGQLEAFSKLRQQAIDAFPIIAKQLDDLTKEFSGSVSAAIVDSHKSMEKQRRALTEQCKQLQKTLEDTALELGNIVERNKEDMKNHVDSLDKALREELAESLSRLAGYFEELSKGFVQNYGELTGHYTEVINELRDFVNATRR